MMIIRRFVFQIWAASPFDSKFFFRFRECRWIGWCRRRRSRCFIRIGKVVRMSVSSSSRCHDVNPKCKNKADEEDPTKALRHPSLRSLRMSINPSSTKIEQGDTLCSPESFSRGRLSKSELPINFQSSIVADDCDQFDRRVFDQSLSSILFSLLFFWFFLLWFCSLQTRWRQAAIPFPRFSLAVLILIDWLTGKWTQTIRRYVEKTKGKGRSGPQNSLVHSWRNIVAPLLLPWPSDLLVIAFLLCLCCVVSSSSSSDSSVFGSLHSIGTISSTRCGRWIWV